MFTITRYTGIGERPTVVLINSSYSGGIKCNSIEELHEKLKERGEKIYFTADKDNNRIDNLDIWRDENGVHSFGLRCDSFDAYIAKLQDYITVSSI